jgi:hypothetical protein
MCLRSFLDHSSGAAWLRAKAAVASRPSSFSTARMAVSTAARSSQPCGARLASRSRYSASAAAGEPLETALSSLWRSDRSRRHCLLVCRPEVGEPAFGSEVFEETLRSGGASPHPGFERALQPGEVGTFRQRPLVIGRQRERTDVSQRHDAVGDCQPSLLQPSAQSTTASMPTAAESSNGCRGDPGEPLGTLSAVPQTVPTLPAAPGTPL